MYRQGRIGLTDAGRARAETPPAPLTTEEMHAYVMRVLDGPEQRILQPLLECYPNPMKTGELAQKSGYTEGGGAFNNPKGRLRTLGLIDYPSDGMVVAKSVLFLEG